MTKGKGRNGKKPQDQQKKKPNSKTKRKILKSERRRGETVLRDLHTYTPPETSNIDHLESRDDARTSTILPCQICEIANCGDQRPGHESPIVVDIRSRSKFPAACAIFFGAASAYNKTFLLHDVKANRRRIDLTIAITALKQLCAYLRSRPKKNAPPSKPLDQVVIKTSSKWFVNQFTARTFNHDSRFHTLQLDFKAAVAELALVNEGHPVFVKFWRFGPLTVARELANATFDGWKEAKVRFEVQE